MAKNSGAMEGQQYVRRLMIREMTLDNFKSYAGPQHVGPFHKVRQLSSGAVTVLCIDAAKPRSTHSGIICCSVSHQLWDPMEAARATSSMPCSSCLVVVRSRQVLSRTGLVVSTRNIACSDENRGRRLTRRILMRFADPAYLLLHSCASTRCQSSSTTPPTTATSSRLA